MHPFCMHPWCCCKGCILVVLRRIQLGAVAKAPSACITCVLHPNHKLGTFGLVTGDVRCSCAVLLVATYLRGLSGSARDGGAVPCSVCQSRLCIAALLRPTSTLTLASCDAPRGLAGAGRLGGNLPALPTQYLHNMRLHVFVREGERVRVSVYVCMCVCV